MCGLIRSEDMQGLSALNRNILVNEFRFIYRPTRVCMVTCTSITIRRHR